MPADIRVGTSGWQYADWRGLLYPAGVPQRSWLSVYTRHFDTVEVNNAFYRLPEKSVFERWRESVPAGFVMAVKASRYLTHIKRLRDPEEPVARLMERAAGLGDRLGPVLLQLPPDLVAVPDRLDACLAAFPSGVRVAVEPRHASWWTDEVRAVLISRGAALCWADRRGRPVTPLWRTVDWAYLRLHEGRAQPWPSYGPAALHTWARRLRGAAPTGSGFGPGSGAGTGPARQAYVYFNNDPGGAAVHNARTFRELVGAG